MAIVAVSGCSTTYSGLSDENANPRLAALKAPLASATVSLVDTPGPPAARVAIHRVAGPTGAPVVAFIHGAMSDFETWRFVAGPLAGTHELWLLDLPGCGKSDTPDPDRFGEGVYAPEALAARVRDALRAEASTRGVTRITLVGHSLGAAVALRLAAEPSVPVIERLVLLSPLDAAVGPPNPTIRELATASSLKLATARATGVLRERFAQATRDSVCDPSLALRQEVDKRLRSFDSGPRTRALQATLRQAVPWRGEQLDWDRVEAIEASYSRVGAPCLILTGRRDSVLPPSMGYKVAAELDATLVALPRVMHSPQLEAPEETASLIAEFVATGRVASERVVRNVGR
ncbi:MAG: alpha/beta fold hydrolase [Phycisphaerae bacterium]|nr:alpha/beta fold hydrolase [Phycisphaerae bacterium]